jgi:hypothetical protein
MMMKRISTVVLLCLVALGLNGCATGRISDLRDCGRVSVGYGLGLGAEANLGIVGNPSLGIMANKAMFGFEDRGCAGMWAETESFFPASSVIGAMMRGMSDGGPSSDTSLAPYGRQIQMNTRGGKSLPRDQWITHSRERNFLVGLPTHDRPARTVFRTATDIEVGGTLGFVSVRVGINPLEILDFALGFVGFDIAGDDSVPEFMGTADELSRHTHQQKLALWRSMGSIVNPVLVAYLREHPDNFVYEKGDDEATVAGFAPFLRSRLTNEQSLQFDTRDRLLDPWGDPVHFVVDHDADMKLTARGQYWGCYNPKGNAHAVGLLLDKPDRVSVSGCEQWNVENGIQPRQ